MTKQSLETQKKTLQKQLDSLLEDFQAMQELTSDLSGGASRDRLGHQISKIEADITEIEAYSNKQEGFGIEDLRQIMREVVWRTISRL